MKLARRDSKENKEGRRQGNLTKVGVDADVILDRVRRRGIIRTADSATTQDKTLSLPFSREE